METPQLNQVFKNKETPQKFCRNASKKEETPQLNQVLKNTETPQKFCGNASKKRGNISTKSGF